MFKFRTLFGSQSLSQLNHLSFTVSARISHCISWLRCRLWMSRGVFIKNFIFFSNFSQFCPDLVIISAGYDSALGDEKVPFEFDVKIVSSSRQSNACAFLIQSNAEL